MFGSLVITSDCKRDISPFGSFISLCDKIFKLSTFPNLSVLLFPLNECFVSVKGTDTLSRYTLSNILLTRSSSLDSFEPEVTFNFKNEPVTVPTSDELDAIEKSSDIEAFASPE